MVSRLQIAKVERYFEAVDQERLEEILGLLTDDCRFSVETHGVVLNGKIEIAEMFHKLWTSHRAVRHHSFVHVCDAEMSRIASQFQVENTELDGSLTRKSNCNFFTLAGDLFSQISVYMAGPNTLKAQAN